jgi:hypothetical protein
MNAKILMIACATFISAIFGIAASSIATECFNKNESYKTEKKSNYDFIIFNLVCNIIMLLLGAGCMYLGATSPF